MAELGLHRQTFSNLNTAIVTRFPDAIQEELDRVAEVENVTRSDVIRYAVIRYLMERRTADNGR